MTEHECHISEGVHHSRQYRDNRNTTPI